MASGEHRDEHRVDRDAHAGTWRSRQQEHQRSRHAVRDFGQVFESLDVVPRLHGDETLASDGHGLE